MPIKPECSVNEVAFLTAEYYVNSDDKDDKDLAVECVKNHFSIVKEKVSFFKGNDFIQEALDILYEEQQYDDLYRLLKAQGRFPEGVEKCLELQDDYNYCVFLLLLVKSKLYSSDNDQGENQYSKKARAKDVAELEKASRKIKDVELKTEIELFIGLVKNDAQICLRVSKKIRNHFGAIEALTAALKFSYTLSKSIEIVLKCLQDTRDVIDAFKAHSMPEKVAGELLKFYGFEKSSDRYFLPPQQFYWLPELAKHSFDVRDSDGMIQLRESDVYSTIHEHVINSAKQWLSNGKLDVFLYGSINSNPLNTAVMKPGKDFAILCSMNSQELSSFIKCCTQLITLGHFYHLLGSKLSSATDNFRSVDHMISSGANRIVNVFSNQWNFYLTLNPTDISKVRSSALVCREVNAGIDNFLKKKSYVPTQDINGFLYKWLILKVTDTSVSELENNLKEQENFLKKSSPLLIEERKADNASDYIHSFMMWPQACNSLVMHGNIMEFASKVIKRFILFNAKSGGSIPKISVLNAITLLEIVSIGLLGVLQASAVHLDYDKVSVILPEFYCHAIELFDNIHCGEENVWLLTAASKTVVNIPIKKLAYLNKDSYKLLCLVMRLLVGLHLPYFNILMYALARSAPNNGFERCFALSTCLFANLAPLISKKQIQMIHYNLCSLMNDIPNDYAELKAVVYRISMANDTNEIFHALLALQQRYNKGMVSLTYNYNKTKFEFVRVNSTEFPTYALGHAVENIPPTQPIVSANSLNASSNETRFPVAVPSLPMRQNLSNDLQLSQSDVIEHVGSVDVTIPSTQTLQTTSSIDLVVTQLSEVAANDTVQTSPVMSQINDDQPSNNTEVSKHDHIHSQVQDCHNSPTGVTYQQVQDSHNSDNGMVYSQIKGDQQSATDVTYQQVQDSHNSDNGVAYSQIKGDQHSATDVTRQQAQDSQNSTTGVTYTAAQIEHEMRTLLASPNFNLFTFLLYHGMPPEIIQHHLIMAQQCLVQLTTPPMMHNIRPTFPDPPRMRFAENKLPSNIHLSPPHGHRHHPPYIRQPPPHQYPTNIHQLSSENQPYRQIAPMKQNFHSLSVGERMRNPASFSQDIRKSVPLTQNPSQQMKSSHSPIIRMQAVNKGEIPSVTQHDNVIFHNQLPTPHSQLYPTPTDSDNVIPDHGFVMRSTNQPTTQPNNASLSQELLHDEPPIDYQKQVGIENSQAHQNINTVLGQQAPALEHLESFDEEYEQIEDYSELYSVQEVMPVSNDTTEAATDSSDIDKTFCSVCITHLCKDTNAKDENQEEHLEKFSDHYASEKHKEKALQYEQYKCTLEQCTITVNAAKDILATKKKCKYPQLLKKINSIDENLKRFGLSHSFVHITADWVKGETSVKNIITELTQFIQEYKMILNDILQQAQALADEDTALLDVGVPSKKTVHHN